MTNLSACWLEEHKGSPKHTTTAKPAKKQSKRPSSLYSPCYPVSSIKLRQHFPFLSSPSRSPQSSKTQHTNKMCLRTTSTGQHFLGDSPSQKIPGSAQTCWEKATLISCSSSTVHDLLFWSTDQNVASQPQPDGKANHCSYRLFQLGRQPQVIPFSQQKNTLLVVSLNLYYWKGNNVRIFLAASSIPYLPVYTGNYIIITSHSWTQIIMGVYYFSPTTSASNSRKLNLTKPAHYGNSQLCQNIKEAGHTSSSCILEQYTHTAASVAVTTH